jgi:hypothetical protein
MQPGNPQLHHETVESRARPARVAVLMDSSDVDWHHTAERILEFLSSIWGGKHSLIVPTDGIAIDKVFWIILEKFSPDYIYFYQKTWADIKISCPPKYEAVLQQRTARYPTEVLSIEGEKERIEKELCRTRADTFYLGTELRSEIASRLIPFHFERNFYPVFGNGHVPNELTSIFDVLPFVEHTKLVATFGVPSGIEYIWSAACTGTFSKTVGEEMQKAPLNEIAVQVSIEDLGSFAGWIAGGTTVGHNFNKVLNQGPGLTPPDEARPTPFDISMCGVASYGPPQAYRDLYYHFCVVIGDSISDFCLSYCLPRIGRRAAWLPSRWLEEIQSVPFHPLGSCVSSVMFATPVEIRMSGGPEVCSFSKGAEYFLETFEKIKKLTGFGLNNEKVKVVTPQVVVAGAPAALVPYCIDSPNHADIYPFLGDKSVGTIRSPRPSGFSKLNATKHRWVAEIAIRNRPIPSIPNVPEQLAYSPGLSGTHDVRVSRQGLAYVCPSSLLIIGEDMGSNLQNPEIRLFDTFTAISQIAAANGYQCQLSDKGIFQQGSLEKLKGVSGAAKLLKDSHSRTVLEKFLDHKQREPGIFDEGCVLQKRTYLDLTATRKLMGGDEDAAASLLDSLSAAKVLNRGFALCCGICKHAAWYSFADMTDEFRCQRCGRAQTLSRDHWKHPAAPQVHYKLDEIVYQFLRNDGAVVALSLDYMARTSSHPINYSPELKFQDRNSTFSAELDLCAVWDGVLAIGEAKKNDELARSDAESRKIIEKYVRMADLLKARRVFFCTSSEEWKSSAVAAIHQAFHDKLAIPILLGAKDLLGGT